MRVKDVMTEDVAMVEQSVSLKEVARLMVECGVSGIPVVNSERLVLGVVSEADLIAKAASRPEGAGVLGGQFRPDAIDERRLSATTAAEAMSTPPVTIDVDRSVGEAARLMVERRVNRLPVLNDGRLVGIVTRADLVRAFTRSDAEILDELRNDVLPNKLWISPNQVDITVIEGRVTVTGRVSTRTEVGLIEAFAWRLAGVVTVDCSGLSWESDDRAARAGAVEPGPSS
jgi:CBS domain-containing protein